MLLLNKKYQIISIGLMSLFLFSLLHLNPALALSPNINQVKLSSSSAVYFLSHKYHRKKAYVNATAYLSYNNQWSTVKNVSATELASWPDAKLFKIAGSPTIYYIHGGQKAALANLDDLISFGLSGEPVLEVGAIDLDQYQLVDYATIGLISNGSSNNNNTSGATLYVTRDLVTGANNNTLVAGTEGNLVGIFHFSASEAATVTDLTFDFSGLYSSGLLQDVFLLDGNNNSLLANIHINNRQAVVHFRSALNLTSGSEQIVKVYSGLGACSTDCTNQTISVALKQADSVTSNAVTSAVWPLQGTTFQIVNGTMIGQLAAQVESLAGTNLTVSNGNRLISQLRLTETTGREDVLVKQLVFENNGTASKDDWEDFRLLNGNNIIARVDQVNANGQIVFDINYLRVLANAPVELSVLAGLTSNYHPQATFNLQLASVWSEGNSYHLSLAPVINNFSETYPLN